MLSKNERNVLMQLAENSRKTDIDIAKELGITSQAVGKIRRKLENNEVIKSYDLNVDLEKVGINIISIAMIKLLRPAWNKGIEYLKEREEDSAHVISAYMVTKADFSMIVIYGFKNIVENEQYFTELQMKHDEIELTDTYTFSTSSVLKQSFKELIKSVLKGPDQQVKPLPFNRK
jgi:Lrp/AsnC family transcriptional regulator, leucine-responsive regulatory protein